MKTDKEILSSKNSFQVYHEPLGSNIHRMSDEELGQIFRAIFVYSRDDVTTEFEDRFLSSVYSSMKNAVDVDRKKYIKRSRQNSKNRTGGQEKSTVVDDGLRTFTDVTDTDTDTETETETDTDVRVGWY